MLWWLSYASATRSYGVVVTEAASFESAASRAEELGLAPRVSEPFEVMGLGWPDMPDALEELSRFPRDVLISPERLDALGYVQGIPDEVATEHSVCASAGPEGATCALHRDHGGACESGSMVWIPSPP